MTGIRPDAESVAREQILRELPRGSHVHVSGICGTGVSAVAVLLKDLGYRVTGSDKAFYPPMGELARKTAEKLYTGYAAENLAERPDFVIIGNNLSRNNPEVEEVITKGIPYASMPEAFGALLIGTREHCPTSIVVSGTHGKTTTSAATATILEHGKLRPGYFIGGIPTDLPTNIRAVDLTIPLERRTVVLEGDEYDSAFFAKWSKFHSYRPDIAIVTSIEFDHADIFPSIKEIEEEFFLFLKKVPKNGLILFCDTEKHLQTLAQRWQGEFEAQIAFYGFEPTSPFRILSREQRGPLQCFQVDLEGEKIDLQSPLSGAYNALNLLAAAASAKRCGVGSEDIKNGVLNFHGVLRRQRSLGEFRGVLLIEDFAHHPSAVRATLQGLRELHPDRRLVAVFEPRSNTSRRNYFQREYEDAFTPADVAVIQSVQNAGGYSKTGSDFEALNVTKIIEAITSRGGSGVELANPEAISTWLQANTRSGDLVVLMSNGDFGGLAESLPGILSRGSATSGR